MAKKATAKKLGITPATTKAYPKPPPIDNAYVEEGAEQFAAPKKAKAKKKPKAKVKAPKAPKQQHPTEIKPHTPTLAPKSELPKDYKHPIGHPKKGVTLPPSKEGLAFEKEREDERKRTAVPPDRNWYDLPGGKPPGGKPGDAKKVTAKKAAPKQKKK